MQNINNENKSVLMMIKSVFADPVVIYTVLIMMSIMNHYRSSLAFVDGFVSLLMVGIIFRIYDFIAKHKLIGIPTYLTIAALFGFAIRECIDNGARTYPIRFMLWFMTPQDSLDYSKWYTIAVFLLFMIFMTSVIYYFTKIRYRIFMNFLIFIIPFAIYGKEYEKMPTAYIILLAIGYILIMVKSRQLTENSNTVIIGKVQTWSSVASYVLLFAVTASIIPKPDIQADREILDEMIAADAFTDRLVEMLNVFRDTSTNEAFLNVNDDNVLYYAKADESLRLKTQVFTEYSYEDDSWTVNDENIHFDITSTDESVELSYTGKLIEAIDSALNYSPELAEKYNLTDFDISRFSLPDSKECTIFTAGTYAQFAPVPTQFHCVSFEKKSDEDEVAVLRNGALYICDDYFSTREIFTFEYTPDTLFLNQDNKTLIDMIPTDDYEQFLMDCSDAVYDYDIDAWYEINNHARDVSIFDAYLDYGKVSEIKNLADEITEGLTSDYDKAKAIESYFAREDFTYDLSYKKEKGDNVVDFLYESKTGVCYEFATAMVLLSRAAGIPARFTEGYSMSEASDKEDMDFVIKAKHAHGFPELYIKGVGWISFEPTISADEQAAEDEKTATDNLAKAGIYLLICAVFVVLIIMFYPAISHKVFLIRLRRMNRSEAVILIMRRITVIFRLGNALTSKETAENIAKLTELNISTSAEIFDKAAYDKADITEDEFEIVRNDYIAVYEAKKAMKKRSRRNKKVSA